MRVIFGRQSVAKVFALCTALGFAFPWVAAAESERGMKWQVSIPVSFTSGASFDGTNGASVDVNDDLGFGFGFGFGFGYNLNTRFLLAAEFTWLSANYNATIATDGPPSDGVPDGTTSLSGTLDAANMQFVGQYNILASRWTPFLRSSFGWTWIDSNIPSAPPQGSCWWTWYGYVCNTWQPTYEDTAFAYGAAVGVRGDVTGKFLLEASNNILWIDLENDTASMDGVRLNIGWTF